VKILGSAFAANRGARSLVNSYDAFCGLHWPRFRRYIPEEGRESVF
jgi:hypothetical protein